MTHFSPPSGNCHLCPRLAAFREANRKHYPGFFNAPVPSFGGLDAKLLIVGLAPGLKGANQTGRPFTGDYAGLVLYSSLLKHSLAEGSYEPLKVRNSEGDGLRLLDCRITNAVRCVPQQNKPEPSEIKQCNGFLAAEINAMPNLTAFVTLGLIAHKAVLIALGLRQSAFTFGHNVRHEIKLPGRILLLFNTYHCSRYNINTGRLTQVMFDEVMGQAKKAISEN